MPDFVEDHVPDEFFCPIGRELMIDPVACADGFAYERVNIESWLEGHTTSAMTGAPLASVELHPIHPMRKHIEELVRAAADAGEHTPVFQV